MYKSAEEHTKVKGKLSKGVIILPFVLLATAYGFYHLKQRYRTLTADPTQQTQQAAKAAVPQADAERAALAISDAEADGTYSTEQRVIKPEDYKPVFDGQPWTAPVYNAHNQQIATMPFPVACIKTQDRCTCYTDQATPIRGMDKGLCIDFAENGIYNPYRTAAQSAAADKS